MLKKLILYIFFFFLGAFLSVASVAYTSTETMDKDIFLSRLNPTKCVSIWASISMQEVCLQNKIEKLFNK